MGEEKLSEKRKENKRRVVDCRGREIARHKEMGWGEAVSGYHLGYLVVVCLDGGSRSSLDSSPSEPSDEFQVCSI